MKKKIDYIDGIKGVGCMMVMLGHYYCIYSLAESFIQMPQGLAYICKALAFFLDADLGLFIFAILSGYCIAMSKIDAVKKLNQTIVKRFLRFFIPVLGANLIIYMIYQGLGFHNADTVQLFSNTWFQSYYQNDMWLGLAVRDSVMTVVGKGAVFNAPFWIVRYFFYASAIVYVGNYLENKCGNNFKYVLYLLELAVATRWLNTNGFAIVLGAILYKEQENKFLERILNKKALAVMTVICFWLLSGGAEWLAALTMVGEFATTWSKILYAAVILYAISQLEVLQKVLSNRLLVNLSKLSFGIYALHWPVICSVSSLLFLKVKFNALSYIMIGLGTVVIVLLLAVIYHLTVEKICSLFLRVLSEKKILG